MEQLAKATEKIGLTDNKEPETEAAGASEKQSKNALKKAEKEAAKAQKKAERAAAMAAQQAGKAEDTGDVSKDKYGVLPLVQSKDGSRTGATSPVNDSG